MPVLNLVHINIHVSNLDRSIEFYSRLGWTNMLPGGSMGKPHPMPSGPLDVSPKNEYGGGTVRGAILTLSDDPRAATKLELIEYIDPPATPRPHKPRQETGVHRIAMRVKGIDDMVRDLRAAGVTVPFDPVDVSVEGLGSKQRYVLVPDPDEVMIELVELFK